jgi:putative endonuclease
MDFVVYILQSKTNGRLYIGQTNDLAKRLLEHNEGITKSTKGKGPWELLHFKAFPSRNEAMVFEKKLKNWKSHVRIIEWIQREKLN